MKWGGVLEKEEGGSVLGNLNCVVLDGRLKLGAEVVVHPGDDELAAKVTVAASHEGLEGKL